MVDITRQSADGILAGERIAIVVSRSVRDGIEVTDLGPVEESIEPCLRGEAQGAKPDLAFLSPTELRQLIAAGKAGSDAFKSPDSLLRATEEPATSARIAQARVRYVLLVEASYEVGRSTSLNTTSGQGGLMTGASRTQLSNLQTHIVDLKRREVAGSIGSIQSGTEWGGVGVMFGMGYPLPLPVPIPVPLYSHPMTESNTCAAMGAALARFMSVSVPGGDARWRAYLSCGATEHGPAFYRVDLVAFSPTDNHFVLQHGNPGKPASFRLLGSVEPDGRLELSGAGLARNSGVPFVAAFQTTLVEGSYEGRGYLGAQPCKISISQR